MFYNRKSQTGSSDLFGMTLIYPVETFKHSVLIFCRDSDSRILNHDLRFLGSLCQKYTYISIISVVFDRIVTNVINRFFQKCPNRLNFHGFSTDIKMNIHLLCFLFQTVKSILADLINIHRFPDIWCFFLIQLRNLDHIFHQLKKSLRFFINTSCKLRNILFLHKAILNDLRKSGNGSQRRFQFMGDICGKFPSQILSF